MVGLVRLVLSVTAMTLCMASPHAVPDPHPLPEPPFPFKVNTQCAPEDYGRQQFRQRYEMAQPTQEVEYEGSEDVFRQVSFFERIKNAVFGHSGRQFPLMAADGASDDEANHPLAVDLSQYEDEAVLRFNWTDHKHGKRLLSATETLVLDVWNVQNDSADVRINKKRVRDFLKLIPKPLRQESQRSTYVEDLQRAVLATIPLSTRPSLNNDFFSDYRNLEQIRQWLSNLPRAEINQVGTTFEGREIESISIGHGPLRVFITGGMHAREWTTTHSLLYALEQLLFDEDLLSIATIKLMPISNPDGYAYTWQHDRLWRKNREATGVGMCSGVDIAESLHWSGEPNKRNLATTACSETYAGKAPLLSVEAQSIAKLVREADVYIDMRSYGQQLAVTERASKRRGFEDMVEHIRKETGREYQVSTLRPLYQPRAVDVYQVRLPDVDGTGVLAHKRQIKPVGEECIKMIKLLIEG